MAKHNEVVEQDSDVVKQCCEVERAASVVSIDGMLNYSVAEKSWQLSTQNACIFDYDRQGYNLSTSLPCDTSLSFLAIACLAILTV